MNHFNNANLINISKNLNTQNITTTVPPTAPTSTKSPCKIVECIMDILKLFEKPYYTDLTITKKAWIKLMCFINLIGDYEISGFGRVQDNKVTDFDIIKQTVQGAYVESDEDAVMDFIRRTPPKQREEWTLDWHSHVNMSTGPSGTDWSNYEDMIKLRMGKQFPIMIVNKKQEATSYCIISPNRHTPINLKVETTEVTTQEIKEIYQECKEKIETLCSCKTYTTTYATTFGFNSSAHEQERDADWYEKYYGNDDDDDEIIEAKKQGFVFDDEKDKSPYILEENECAMCGKRLNTQQELNMGVCNACYQEALHNTGNRN